MKNNDLVIEYLSLRKWAISKGFSTRNFMADVRKEKSLLIFMNKKKKEYFFPNENVQASFFDNSSRKKTIYNIQELEKFKIKYKEIFYEKKINAIPLESFNKLNLLKTFGDKKIILYLRGKPTNIKRILNNDLNDSIAIVGSRKTREENIDFIDKIVKDKKVIVSGLAYGADLIGHREAIKQKKDIIIFPGFSIDWEPPKKKKDVFKYALDNGVIISTNPPLSPFAPGLLQQRNIEMANITSKGFVLYIDGWSGTLGYMREIVKLGKSFYIPKNVFKNNKEMLIEKENFNLENIKILKWNY